MAQIGAVFVFCSSCKILCFASSVHPKNATDFFSYLNAFGGNVHRGNNFNVGYGDRRI